jgi:hypothetical protein
MMGERRAANWGRAQHVSSHLSISAPGKALSSLSRHSITQLKVPHDRLFGFLHRHDVQWIQM